MHTSLKSLSAYGALVLDCDGVILDSNKLKIDAFRDTLLQFDFPRETIEKFSAFQVANFGTSRHRLFAQLLAGSFGPIPSVTQDALLQAFGELVSRGYLMVAETEDLRPTLARLSTLAPLYVVSGSDEAELRAIFQARTLASCFAQIYGSPANKEENLARVRADLAQSGIDNDKLLFIGDAEADANAAAKAGADFVFAARFSTVRSRMEARARAEGFAQVELLADLLTLDERKGHV